MTRRIALLALFAAGLLASSAMPSSRSGAADASLVGRWQLDQIDGANGIAIATTPDSSGSNLTARVAGSVRLAAGKYASAFTTISVNGAPSGANVPSDPRLAPQNLTVLAWVKRSGTPGQAVYVVAKGAQDCSAASYALYTGASGGLAFYVNLGQGAVVSPDAGQGVWDGNWHAVAGTFDGTTARLYVDGSEVGSGTRAQGSIAYGKTDVSSDLAIGFYPGGSGCWQQYAGSIDQVELYSRALRPDELRWLAAGGGASPPELPPPATTTAQSTTTTRSTTTTPTTTTAAPPPPTTTQPSSLQVHVATAASKTLRGGTWLDASANGTIVKYAWDTNGDGNFDLPCGLSAKHNQAPAAMSIAFATPGEHKVGLQVTDVAGRVATTTMILNVKRRDATNAGKLIGNVVDCENPGANNQPDRQGCVKTFAFGIVEVNSRGEPGDCFKITNQSLASKVARSLQGVPGKSKELVQVYHAEIDGPVAINGLYVPVPESQHSAYDTYDGTIGLGNHETLFGTYRTLPVNLNLAINPDSSGYFKIADVSLKGAVPKIGGLAPDAGVTLGFVNRKTQVVFHLKLPAVFKFEGGGDAEAKATFLMSNEDGLVFDGGQLGPVDVLLGPMLVSSLQLAYSDSHQTWSGGASLQLLPVKDALGLRAAPPPPDLGFGLKAGGFDHAGAGVQIPAGAQPQLFPGIFLTHIDLAIGKSPLRVTGDIGLSAAHAMDIDGEVFVALASTAQPYTFPDQSGDLQPLAGRTLTSFAIAVGGKGSLDVPVIGKIPLVDGYLLYEYPSFFELAGGFRFEVSFLTIDGGVHGFVDGGTGRWDYDMGVKACLNRLKIWEVSLDGICLSVGGVISSKGFGFCGVVPVPAPIVGTVPVDVGAGYSWGDSFPDLMIFDCDYGPWKESVPNTHRALQAGGTTVSLSNGPAAMIRVLGSGGTPDVTLTGPAGKTISTAAPAVDRNVAVVKLASANETLIAFRNPAGSRWTITQAGSVPVKSIAVSAGMPAPNIAARVTGAGRVRTLAYTIARANGATVTFAERGRATYRVLGTAIGASGRLHFTSALGPAGKRDIVAELVRNGVPVRKSVVATYNALGFPKLARPAGVRVQRHGSTVVVHWRPVGGAALYAVTFTTKGARTMAVVRGTTASFSGFSGAGTALVGALDARGARGPVGRAAVGPAPVRRARTGRAFPHGKP